MGALRRCWWRGLVCKRWCAASFWGLGVVLGLSSAVFAQGSPALEPIEAPEGDTAAPPAAMLEMLDAMDSPILVRAWTLWRLDREAQARLQPALLLRQEAARAFEEIYPLVAAANEEARPILEAYLEKYEGASVRVDGQKQRVVIEQLNEVQAALHKIRLRRYALILAGRFTMGSPISEAGRDSDEIEHPVELAQAFWMKVTPVTTGEWRAVVGNRPSESAYVLGDDCPVEGVNWFEAVAYANTLSEREGLGRCYALSGCSGALGGGEGSDKYTCRTVERDKKCTGYRLPTEAEWEYAYRAGTVGAYYAQPVDAIAWYDDNSGKRTRPVGQKKANAWGLYDMAGNVWEWVEDEYEDYIPNDEAHPHGPTRVLRGGSWLTNPKSARAAQRGFERPAQRRGDIGFRLVKVKP